MFIKKKVYEFNETLAKEVENLGIADKPEALYNCDKPGFPVASSKCKYIGPTGKKNHSGYSWNQQRESKKSYLVRRVIPNFF